MGHAGAIISGGKGTAAEKIAALNAVGIPVARTVADIGETVIKLRRKRAFMRTAIPADGPATKKLTSWWNVILPGSQFFYGFM